jgi:tRNA-specific 2-thiouridylase
MKIAIALSGGVDSAVAAYECMAKGHDCFGVTMRLPGGDTAPAEDVANRLGLALHIYDACNVFEQAVIQPFSDGYANGFTPNPCVDCNRAVKLGAFMDYALTLGADCIATGHYAMIKQKGRLFYLTKAADEKKDQGYFLYTLTQERLSRLMFPLGSYTKTEVREKARRYGFANADKPESQDICFIPGGDYAGYLTRYGKRVPEPGYFTDINGNRLGRHKGLFYYTVGQRKGLGIALGAPMFVIRIDTLTNSVVLTPDDKLYKNEIAIEDIHFMGQAAIDGGEYMCKVRYAHKPAKCRVCADGKVLFEEPVRAPTPGQSAVFYRDDYIMFGGIIT